MTTFPADVTRVDSAPIGERRPQIGRYGLWQLRDYMTSGGIPTLLVISLFGSMSVMSMLSSIPELVELHRAASIAKYGSMSLALAGTRHEMSTGFLSGFLGVVVYLGALFAMQGIVAQDRNKGFFRFLFAKPVAPSRYYGQAFWIHAVGFAAIVALLAAVYGHFVEPILSATLLAGVVLMWCCYAGITFLFSALAKFDWLALVAVTLVAKLAWERWGDSPSTFARLLYLLPPVHRADEVYRALAERTAVPWSLVAWFAGYGLLCFAAALVVLRHRRLAIP